MGSELYQAVLKAIETLVDMDPQPGTPEFDLLVGLSGAVDQYERVKFSFQRESPTS